MCIRDRYTAFRFYCFVLIKRLGFISSVLDNHRTSAYRILRHRSAFLLLISAAGCQDVYKRQVLKLGSIPSVLKATMNMAGIAAGECRKPIIMPNEAVLAEIREMLQYYVQEGEM